MDGGGAQGVGERVGADQLERGLDAAADRDTDAYVAAQAKVTADQPGRLKLAKAVGLQDCSLAPETPKPETPEK